MDFSAKLAFTNDLPQLEKELKKTTNFIQTQYKKQMQSAPDNLKIEKQFINIEKISKQFMEMEKVLQQKIKTNKLNPLVDMPAFKKTMDQLGVEYEKLTKEMNENKIDLVPELDTTQIERELKENVNMIKTEYDKLVGKLKKEGFEIKGEMDLEISKGEKKEKAPPPQSTAEAISRAAAAIAEQLKKKLGFAIDPASKMIKNFGSSISTFVYKQTIIGRIWDGAKKTAEMYRDSPLPGFLGAIGKDIGRIGKVLTSGAKMLGDGIMKGAKAMVDGAKMLTSKLKEGMGAMASSHGINIGDMASIGGIINGMMNELTQKNRRHDVFQEGTTAERRRDNNIPFNKEVGGIGVTAGEDVSKKLNANTAETMTILGEAQSGEVKLNETMVKMSDAFTHFHLGSMKDVISDATEYSASLGDMDHALGTLNKTYGDMIAAADKLNYPTSEYIGLVKSGTQELFKYGLSQDMVNDAIEKTIANQKTWFKSLNMTTSKALEMVKAFKSVSGTMTEGFKGALGVMFGGKGGATDPIKEVLRRSNVDVEGVQTKGDRGGGAQHTNISSATAGGGQVGGEIVTYGELTGQAAADQTAKSIEEGLAFVAKSFTKDMKDSDKYYAEVKMLASEMFGGNEDAAKALLTAMHNDGDFLKKITKGDIKANASLTKIQEKAVDDRAHLSRIDEMMQEMVSRVAGLGMALLQLMVGLIESLGLILVKGFQLLADLMKTVVHAVVEGFISITRWIERGIEDFGENVRVMTYKLSTLLGASTEQKREFDEGSKKRNEQIKGRIGEDIQTNVQNAQFKLGADTYLQDILPMMTSITAANLDNVNDVMTQMAHVTTQMEKMELRGAETVRSTPTADSANLMDFLGDIQVLRAKEHAGTINPEEKELLKKLVRYEKDTATALKDREKTLGAGTQGKGSPEFWKAETMAFGGSLDELQDKIDAFSARMDAISNASTGHAWTGTATAFENMAKATGAFTESVLKAKEKLDDEQGGGVIPALKMAGGPQGILYLHLIEKEIQERRKNTIQLIKQNKLAHNVNLERIQNELRAATPINVNAKIDELNAEVDQINQASHEIGLAGYNAETTLRAKIGLRPAPIDINPDNEPDLPGYHHRFYGGSFASGGIMSMLKGGKTSTSASGAGAISDKGDKYLVHNGEAIINAESTKKLGPQAFDLINKGKIEEAGKAIMSRYPKDDLQPLLFNPDTETKPSIEPSALTSGKPSVPPSALGAEPMQNKAMSITDGTGNNLRGQGNQGNQGNVNANFNITAPAVNISVSGDISKDKIDSLKSYVEKRVQQASDNLHQDLNDTLSSLFGANR